MQFRKWFNGALIASALALLVITPVSASYIVPDGAITTAKLASGAVTQAKRAALGQQISTSSSNYTTTSDNVAVTNLSVTITTTGRPVFVGLISDGTANNCTVGYTGAAASSAGATLGFYRGVTQITQMQIGFGVSSGNASSFILPCTAFYAVEVPSSGTYTYTFKVIGHVGTTQVQYAELIAYEL